MTDTQTDRGLIDPFPSSSQGPRLTYAGRAWVIKLGTSFSFFILLSQFKSVKFTQLSYLFYNFTSQPFPIWEGLWDPSRFLIIHQIKKKMKKHVFQFDYTYIFESRKRNTSHALVALTLPSISFLRMNALVSFPALSQQHLNCPVGAYVCTYSLRLNNSQK